MIISVLRDSRVMSARELLDLKIIILGLAPVLVKLVCSAWMRMISVLIRLSKSNAAGLSLGLVLIVAPRLLRRISISLAATPRLKISRTLMLILRKNYWIKSHRHRPGSIFLGFHRLDPTVFLQVEFARRRRRCFRNTTKILANGRLIGLSMFTRA